MKTIPITDEQRHQWNEQGYFMVRGVIPRDTVTEIRGVIRNQILMGEPSSRRDQLDPMAPPGTPGSASGADDAVEARLARLRKLGNFCCTAPLIWHSVQAGEPVLSVVRQFLGDDLLIKFNSCFIKPARTGSPTPWHQDNALWRDGETEPFNCWIAIDPATRENGCMQFVPGTHTGPIHQHVMASPKSIHAELPPEVVREAIGKHGLHYIEAQPGDMVCWHSSLFHYSPANPSDHGRIAIAGVFTTPSIADRSKQPRTFLWCMKQGRINTAFPPEPYVVGGDKMVDPGSAAGAKAGAANAGY